jgi:hypothetical protein
MNGEAMQEATMLHLAHVWTVEENAKKKKRDALPANASRLSRKALKKKSFKTRKAEYLAQPGEQEKYDALDEPNKKYFSSMCFIPSTAKVQVGKLALVFSMDGCVGKRRGVMYNHFYVVGLSSNNNLVVLLYGMAVGNESEAVWRMVTEYLREIMPELNSAERLAIVDYDKVSKIVLSIIKQS